MFYFTSDIHFNHKFMANLRGYKDVDVMNADLVEKWNDTIQPKDEVWILGDVAFGPKEKAIPIIKGLHGQKTLIAGNHDAPWLLQAPLWVAVHKGFKSKRWSVEVPGQKKFQRYSAFCCHYPMLTWPNAHEGVFHLHGHSHGNLPPDNNTRIDVGIDATGQIAVSTEWVVEEMSKREYDKVDHHGNPKGYFGE